MKIFWSLVFTFICLFAATAFEMLTSKRFEAEKNKLSPSKNWNFWEIQRIIEKPYRVIYDKKLFQLRKQAFYKAYPDPLKVYFRLVAKNLRLIFAFCKTCLLLVKKFKKNRKQLKDLAKKRENLTFAIQQFVFEVWGDRLAYACDANEIPFVRWRNGRSEVGVDCEIYAITIFGEVPDGVLKNIQDRFKTLVNEPVVKVKVVKLPSGKTTRKELVFLVAKRESALHKVNAYFYNNQVKRSDR